jgi:hypothetical protein
MLYKAKENGRHQAMYQDGSGTPQQIRPNPQANVGVAND